MKIHAATDSAENYRRCATVFVEESLSANDIVSSFSSLFRIGSGREEDLDLLRVTGTGRPYLSDPPVSEQSRARVDERCVGFKKKSKWNRRSFLRLGLSVFESVGRKCDETISIERMRVLAVIFAGIVTSLSRVATAPSEQGAVADSRPEGAKLALSPASSLQTETYRDSIDYYNFPIDDTYAPLQSKKCPLCDSSVYPYCGEKLLHDACCCTNPYTHDLPYQCKLADCRFLHANSCREHRLIATCCCSDDYRFLSKSFPNA